MFSLTLLDRVFASFLQGPIVAISGGNVIICYCIALPWPVSS